MECFCKNQTYSLRVEADYVPDPIWCNVCHCNIDIGELPLSDEIKNQLYQWSNEFGKWRHKGSDSFLENAYEIIREYNIRGIELTEKVKKELGPNYTVTYVNSA